MGWSWAARSGAVIALLAVTGQDAIAEPLPVGAVVVLGGIDPAAALAGARSAGGAQWRTERLAVASQELRPAPDAEVAELRRLYLEADFLRCLTTVQDPNLDVDDLLRRGLRSIAAQVGVLAGACAHGAGDESLAVRLVRRVLVAELGSEAILAETTPEFQAAAEQARNEVVRAGTIDVNVRSSPRGASVTIDGGLARCRSSPCRFSLRPGRHLILVEHFGHLERVTSTELYRASELLFALDPAPGVRLRAQIAQATAAGVSPDSLEMAQAFAEAFGARLVVVVWPRGRRVGALVFDRALRRIAARTTALGRDAARVSTQAVVTEWRGIVEPTPLLARPLFWATAAAVAVGAGVATFLLTRPAQERYDLVFQ